MIAVSGVCPSCGHEFTGRFCAHCGEKRVQEHDFTAAHFVEETVEGFTHFDNKFLRTLKLLFFRPGMLTRYFSEGKKVAYMKPVQLFIVSNLLFVLLVGHSNVFAHPLINFLNPDAAFFDTRAAFVARFPAAADFARLEPVFAEKMASQSKAFIILFIPIYALVCALLFRRSKKPLGLHLSFAAHFFSFLLLYFTLFHFLIVLPDRYLVHLSTDAFEKLAIILNLLVLIVYFSVAAHRFYRAGWLYSFFTGMLTGGLFVFLLEGYRILLFYNILRTLH